MRQKSSLLVAALLLFAVLAGIGVASIPPPPPPPVPQNLGIYDTSIDNLQTNTTDQSSCRACHQTTGTNISNGYNNTLGGVPTRHHDLVATSTGNPLTGTPFQCQDCHPSTPGVGNGILLDRSCTDCHNGTSFWGDSIGAHVGNFSRPHHVNTTYDDAHIGNPAAARQCNFCHGSFVDNYNDSHYKPTYATDFMITPLATYKITNFSQPDGLGGNKVWGGCESCHVDNPAATPFPIGENHHNHHKEILGFGLDPSGENLGGTTPFQNASTPFTVANKCTVCHVIDVNNISGNGNNFILELNITNPTTGENLFPAVEVRNSTIENGDKVEVISPNGNITVNGTGCEKCHDVKSIHNIEAPNAGVAQGLGHIGNNTDCYGCHNSWLPLDSAPMAGAIIPTLNSVTPSVIPVGTAATLTLAGSNFVNDVTNPDGTVTHYTSVVTVDGTTYTPSSITDSQITVNIPALAAGIHQLQLVKGTNTLSALVTLTVVSNPTITSATITSTRGGQTLTLTGSGFGNKPAANSQLYVSISHAGNQITAQNIAKWSDSQITAKLPSGPTSGDVVTVLTARSGEAKGTVK